MTDFKTVEIHRDAMASPDRLTKQSRLARCFLPLIAGIVSLWSCGAGATLFSGINWPATVKSKAEAPFTSLVYIDRTTAPEWVLFSGKLDVVTEVVPATGRGVALVYTTGITGVGVSSGLKYQLIGLLPARSNCQFPGTLVVQPQLAVVLPRTIRPVRALVVTVPVKVLINVDTEGNIVEAAAPPTGLMSWWQAEGNGKDVLGANHGILSPLETVGFVPGRIGQAFSFNGDGYVEVPSSPALETPAVTVAAWVRSAGSPGSFSYLLSKGAAACDGSSYALFTGANGGLQFYVSDGVSFGVSPDAGADLWDGDWHLVAGSFDGNTVRLYVDGIEMGSGTAAPLSINYNLATSDSLYIGGYQGSCGLRFFGDVDDVQVFGRALTGIELEGLYDAQY